jgi:hypothetical protein
MNLNIQMAFKKEIAIAVRQACREPANISTWARVLF